MNEETKDQANVGDTPGGDEPKKENPRTVLEELGDSVGKFASKTVESLKRTIDKALDARNTVLTIRVNDEASRKLGMLVETGLFKSRSESAAYLIEEGIKHQESLFAKIEEKMEQIKKLKTEMMNIVSEEVNVSRGAGNEAK